MAQKSITIQLIYRSADVTVNLAHLGIPTSYICITIALVTTIIFGTFQWQQLFVLGEHGSSGSSLSGSKGINGLNGPSGQSSIGKNGNDSNGTGGSDKNLTTQQDPLGYPGQVHSGTGAPSLPKSGLFS
ncbi:hypothetical protein [Nitrososphaera sp. AFS]|uniref:hypothetical protein n=1 Tax=Nitrososphaera sp. AFS TaxID=2301191 RepID=UPI00139240ED|nr:hypothetical protein [Nitrososphaera sp. AFS]NAL78295.1 hypothetical protein [Nitrososphaera sp. AFS]